MSLISMLPTPMPLLRASLVLGALLAAPVAASAEETPPAATGATQAPHQECSARADQTGMTGTMKDTFVTECVAGEKVSDPAKAEAKPK
ncbi:hypothetical protein [Methylobacterium soli]|uniref:Phosphate starvation-inducible protein PsiF n=1 Tax=Methylobacterium soli TaxID=553447 RepID=A0A6L3T1E9_9HYPH|nr:hypothetical protein [Methylobacterium soli]KAB1076912.1 hypothetical protein F6X53_20880 [Methylobacterium soli]GJE40895.1 hypothetical protein AEGHOMDF_0054 [Methylobacterium soli]